MEKLLIIINRNIFQWFAKKYVDKRIWKESQRKKPDIVFVDCVQNFKMPKSANFTEGMCILSKEIKKIATENNFGIIF